MGEMSEIKYQLDRKISFAVVLTLHYMVEKQETHSNTGQNMVIDLRNVAALLVKRRMLPV